jgi:glycosyltransferase involved in cell wall biosynthesis
VTDAELHALYQHALALVCPSRYEGFGLPPVEAMACSCPAIVSNQPALLEVCGAAALHCDADDSVELSRLMRIIHDDPVRRAGLIATGRDRVARFTWRATARILLDVCVQGASIQGHAIAATHAVPQAGESF